MSDRRSGGLKNEKGAFWRVISANERRAARLEWNQLCMASNVDGERRLTYVSPGQVWCGGRRQQQAGGAFRCDASQRPPTGCRTMRGEREVGQSADGLRVGAAIGAEEIVPVCLCTCVPVCLRVCGCSRALLLNKVKCVCDRRRKKRGAKPSTKLVLQRRQRRIKSL